ncbi:MULTISPECIES: TetR/AcrR family transcriptional regulator [Methylorubrum]|uniref:TetR/AcrR family transcriptional regulator n=1 Tax=Methylorubrum TaxID=2282523 RepID=UPI00209CB87F|nr:MULTISPECIES: TetR/AcrR family transcriptional regulator [Methylorubrum]MCP1549629.1 AcrR family transcriptional regulator [Methylorubrum zatmanii]MCP1553757.1 AcrR family transcriptional regulator [Methylorubrum extorquens]MCP1579931.1 AcrR family transcriptional regulator [Methylorubrum extorquens]
METAPEPNTGGKPETGSNPKAGGPSGSSNSETAHKPNPREAAVEALMRLAAEQPWNDIEVGDIAREANLSLAELRDLFPSKGAVLGGLSRIIDRKVLEVDTADLADEPARERLFDVLMRRLDAMTPYKPALRRIAFALRGDVLSMLALNGVALNSHRYMLAAAGIDTEGPLGRLKLQGTVIAFARTVEVWLDDDDPALARTMAKLDREIRRGETIMERADDARRLTAPLRALGRAVLERRPRRDRTEPPAGDGEDRDPAAAI